MRAYLGIVQSPLYDVDPCQLAWQVKQFGRLRRLHPKYSPFLAAEGGEEGRVEAVTNLRLSLSNVGSCQTSWQGAGLKRYSRTISRNNS
jgi:hypothetical protein